MADLNWRLYGPLLLVALLLRVWAWGWNPHPQGDMVTDAEIVRNLSHDGRAVVRETGPHFYALSPHGLRPADQRPLLAHWIATPLTWVGFSPYSALKMVSLVAGLALIPVAGALAQSLWADRPTALVPWGVALCFFLIDNSANGNLYTLQALGIGLALLDRLHGRRRAAFWLGLTFMVNYQSVFLWFAILADMLFSKGLRQGIREAFSFFPLALLTCSPMLIRNAVVFGDPFFQINSTYVAQKLGAASLWIFDGADWIHSFEPGHPAPLAKARTLAVWAVHNIIYTAKQSVFIVGLIGAGVLMNWRHWSVKATSGRRLFVLSAFFLLGMICFYPIVKYRYLVLMTLFLVILGLPRRPLHQILGLGSVLVMSVWMGIATGPGSVYYSGALVDSAAHDSDRDHHHEAWVSDLETTRALEAYDLDHETLMTYRSIQWMLDRQVVILSGVSSKHFREICEHYGVTLVAGRIADPGAGFTRLWSNGSAGIWRRID